MKYFRTTNYKVIELTGFLAFAGVILVQRVIRPNAAGAGEQAQLALGVLPNFFAGIAMAAAIFIIRPGVFYNMGWSNHRVNMVAGLISFFGLWLWEYIQTFTNKPFDWVDVSLSGLGALISVALTAYYIQANERKGILEL